MPSTGEIEKTPFKTMDIKTALMSSGSRKRKASSPQMLSEAKNVKLSLDTEEDSSIEILDEVCGIAVTIDKSALKMSPSDCKENKDVNSSGYSGADKTVELVDLKDDSASNKNTDNILVSKTLDVPNSSSSPTKVQCALNDMEVSDNSKNSDSCDELSTSAIDSAVNVSLNTSGITGDETEARAECSTTNNGGSVNTNSIALKNKSKKKKMTPAEAKKRAEEREKQHKERLLKKQELESKKQERLLEKERRAKEKFLRKEREETERKERERLKQEKKEQEEKEKLLKQKEKEEKLQKKLEELKKREEMRLKKEEELKRTEEEKLKKEQKEKEKAERAKAAFAKFFIKGDASVSTPVAQVPEKEGAFLPFQVSDDMILAPVVPPAAQERFDRKQLDNFLECQNGKELYLQILKSGSYKDVRQRKRIPKLATSEADVIVIDKIAQAELGLRAKLLKFCENVRPPYWGTWRKKSKNIRPRNPFGQDEIFDYSVDSDDEWEEGGPGESLSGTENEDESEDDYEVDNEFFVPHGYLSDEEEKIEDDDEEMNKDPEKQKDLLKKKLQEFEMERKKKTTELKPIILGCYFSNDPRFQDLGVHIFLQNYSVEVITDSPIPTRFTFKTAANSSESPNSSNCGSAQKKKTCIFPENAMPLLIRHIHGNIRNRRHLAEEFQKLWVEQTSISSATELESAAEAAQMEVDDSKKSLETDESNNNPIAAPSDSSLISLSQLKIAIREIATYGKPPEPSINKCCWWVHESVREKYGLIDAPLPNDKSYVSFPSVKVEDKQLNAVKGPSIKVFLSPN